MILNYNTNHVIVKRDFTSSAGFTTSST